MIPRNTSVIAKRVPVTKGKGIQRYLTNAPPTSTRSNISSIPQQRYFQSLSCLKLLNKSLILIRKIITSIKSNAISASEQDKIKSMFQQSEQNWNQEQEKMAS